MPAQDGVPSSKNAALTRAKSSSLVNLPEMKLNVSLMQSEAALISFGGFTVTSVCVVRPHENCGSDLLSRSRTLFISVATYMPICFVIGTSVYIL